MFIDLNKDFGEFLNCEVSLIKRGTVLGKNNRVTIANEEVYIGEGIIRLKGASSKQDNGIISDAKAVLYIDTKGVPIVIGQELKVDNVTWFVEQSEDVLGACYIVNIKKVDNIAEHRKPIR